MTESDNRPVIGRYAPSPTGDLHLGNVRTALLSWLHVRLQQGQYLMRMEDLDTPRVVPGSADQILFDLEWLGLDWDGSVVYQSQRQALYDDAIAKLEAQALVYPCYCSRKDIQQALSAPHSRSTLYPNTCRNLTAQQRTQKALLKSPSYRLRTEPKKVGFVDFVAGECHQNVALECGDFVIKRADGLYAYQLAVVVDDAQQGVTHILRGADLLDSTARQLYLFDVFKQSRPHYLHVALMNDELGQRMSKRDGAFSLSQWRDKGQSPEHLVAYLATSVGLWESEGRVSAYDLLAHLDYDFFMNALRANI